MGGDPFGVAVRRRARICVVFDLGYDIRDVTLGGADVEDRHADGEDVIDLAGVHDPSEGFAHYDRVHVRGGERGRKFSERLVRQALDVTEPARRGELPDLPVLAPAADEAERDVPAPLQPLCRREQRVERVARAVVA